MASKQDRTSPTERIALAIHEARLDHELSLRQLEQMSGVGRHHIRKVERGEHVDPALLVRLGATLMVVDAYGLPSFEDDVAALLHPSTIAQPLPDGGWAA